MLSKYIKIITGAFRDRKNLRLFFHWMKLRFFKILRINFKLEYSADKKKEIDVVIPTVSKDFLLLELLLESLECLSHEVKDVYIVAPKDDVLIDFCEKHGCIFVDELTVLGFGKDRIVYNAKGLNRSGWMFQQLLKLSGENFTKCKDYIVIDSDTVFVNNNSFFENGKYQFFANEEWHRPYFESFKFLFGYKAPTNLSLTSHMMIFGHDYLKQMKNELEQKHGRKWYDVYISTKESGESSCVSDYETYGNWMLYNYPNICQVVPFYNKSASRNQITSYRDIKKRFGSRLKSVSFHSYIKGS